MRLLRWTTQGRDKQGKGQEAIDKGKDKGTGNRQRQRQKVRQDLIVIDKMKSEVDR